MTAPLQGGYVGPWSVLQSVYDLLDGLRTSGGPGWDRLTLERGRDKLRQHSAPPRVVLCPAEKFQVWAPKLGVPQSINPNTPQLGVI